MKRTIILLAVAVMLAAFAAPAWAQAKECNEENKAAWYNTFLANFKGDPAQQKIAYDAAKTYLTTCPEDPEDKVASYMKNKFVVPYEKMTAGATVKKQFEDAFKQKNYADQIKLGKQILETEPDSPAIYIILGVTGLGDQSLLSESAQFAKKAIELIETGKPFAPYETKDKALAALNYTIAKSHLKNAPAEAIPYLLKAARYESDLKKSPLLYVDLAAAYNDGPRAKQSEGYKQYLDKPESPESKLALANINQVIDRQIDALARAAALATNAADKKSLMDVLTETYTDRNKSPAGLTELLAGVLSKPLPDIPTPLTSLPTPAPSTTPGTSASPGTNGGAQTGNGGTKTAGTQAGSAKPVTTAAPGNKPKPPRLNHRRV